MSAALTLAQAALPAVPNGAASKYLAAAYLVFFLIVLIYVAIMANKLVKIEKEVVEIAEIVDKREAAAEQRAKESVT